MPRGNMSSPYVKAFIQSFWLCDLDIWHRVTNLVWDTSTYYYYFYQVSWIYNNNLWSYTTNKVWNTFWPLIVTLTFAIESWVLYATQLQIVVNIFTKSHEDITIICKVMAQTRFKLQKFYLWPLSVTLTFDIESWMLYATHLHIKVNIFNKRIGRTDGCSPNKCSSALHIFP